MGSTSWRDNILQALLIGFVVQIVVSVLWVFCAFLWAAWEERMARPATGYTSRLRGQMSSESMAESDVEMGAVNVSEGATIPVMAFDVIGLVAQIVVSILWVLCDGLWASWKKRMARPATGESISESDEEMGTVNVAEGATIPDSAHALAANSGAGDDGKLEDTENTSDTRVSTPEIPSVHGSSTQGPGKDSPKM